jgi:hypothetical protein
MTSDHSPEIASLRSDLQKVRSEVADLKQHAGKVSDLRDRVREIEETVPGALDDLKRKQAATQESLDTLREMYARDRIVAKAYAELEVAHREWQQKFGRYDEARDMAGAIIDVVASGHINQSVIVDVTQRLAARTPRYWVAHAALAAAGWLDDNPRQHREALEYALALDFEKTSLFMALLLRDQDRHEELQEWLAAYLSRLTPVRLPRHFQVVIDAATGNALGGGAAPRLVSQVGEWYAEEADREGTLDAAVSEWKRRLLSLGARYGENPDFSLLAASETAWKALAPRYEASRAVEQASRYFQGRFEAGAAVSDDIRGDLATLLSDLARTTDPEEERLQSVMREQRAITVADGNLDAARKRIAADERDRNATLNIVAMVSESAFRVPEAGPPPAPTVTELLSIMLSSKYVVTAAEELRADLPRPGAIEIAVGARQWPCQFTYDDPARVTSPPLSAQAEEQARKICAQIQKDAARREGRLRWLGKWACPGGLAAAVGLGGATFIPAAPPELMIPAFAIAIPAILGMNRLPKVVRRAKDQTEAEQRDVTRQVNKAAGQLAILSEADRDSAATHLPALRSYLGALTKESIAAATRPVKAPLLPKTREFPSWTPQPPWQYPEVPPADDPPGLA